MVVERVRGAVSVQDGSAAMLAMMALVALEVLVPVGVLTLETLRACC